MSPEAEIGCKEKENTWEYAPKRALGVVDHKLIVFLGVVIEPNEDKHSRKGHCGNQPGEGWQPLSYLAAEENDSHTD